ncbi:hypothetical protein K6U49_04495 [Vibrio alginolyticus]|uniref:hypothetical protein n=1 Tax=Vibrio alginolyticus TaxID=663 RepID=UPI001EEAA5DF|nr:hypothetical protein [Vibrio alginolyticus]MCG6307879.1 hypothetical protein [Vibrio alginolyticus]
MNNENKEDLFLQIRTAHRLLAAYYQRLLPTIEQISKELELDFYAWTPKEFARPSKLTTNPFDNWQWDMLPALSTYYVFKNVEDVHKLRLGEWLVEFMVDSDTGVDSGAANGAQPDGLLLPISVEEAQSLLKVSIYTPFNNENANWYKVWNRCQSPKFNDSPLPQVDPDRYPIISCGFELRMSELLEEDAVSHIASKTREFIDSALTAALEQNNKVVGDGQQ